MSDKTLSEIICRICDSNCECNGDDVENCVTRKNAITAIRALVENVEIIEECNGAGVMREAILERLR